MCEFLLQKKRIRCASVVSIHVHISSMRAEAILHILLSCEYSYISCEWEQERKRALDRDVQFLSTVSLKLWAAVERTRDRRFMYSESASAAVAAAIDNFYPTSSMNTMKNWNPVISTVSCCLTVNSFRRTYHQFVCPLCFINVHVFKSVSIRNGRNDD